MDSSYLQIGLVAIKSKNISFDSMSQAHVTVLNNPTKVNLAIIIVFFVLFLCSLEYFLLYRVCKDIIFQYA